MRLLSDTHHSRRGFLGMASCAVAAAAISAPRARAARVKTGVRIVIIGAGAAGTALANRLVERLDGATIILMDARRRHLYQPGLSLVAAGLKPAEYAVSGTKDWLPSGVTLIEEAAVEIDPEAKIVTTSGGTRTLYDYLVVAPGLKLDWDAIDGFSADLIGRDGIGALYAGPEEAAKTWQAASNFIENGGTAIVSRPATEMKCAGAPLKHTFLLEDLATRAGTRGNAEFIYAAHDSNLFGVPIVSEKVRMLFGDRDIRPAYSHVLTAIEPGARRATFATPGGDVDLDYDYIQIIPPQRAPDVVRDSPLPWADRWTDQGWVEVDPHTLRHNRYPDVFALGDVAGVPKGKTAASVKWQVPVVEDHVVADIEGTQGTAAYDGYTSCPLITRVGRAMLVEFDYGNNLVPSFPGVIAPLEELWISWLMKEVALKATYNAMLRGKA